MRLATVEAALDAGMDARDGVQRCAVENRLPWYAFVNALWAAIATSRTGPKEPPAAVVATTRTALVDYAVLLRQVADECDDSALAAEADRSTAWSDDLWAAVGRDRVPESRRILEALSPSLERLAEIRTALILGRPHA